MTKRASAEGCFVRLLLPLLAALTIAIAVAAAAAVRPAAGQDGRVDTALLVSVDVSNSVDEHRYRLQMEGIAKALEDPAVIDAITSGPQGGILFSMVVWADRPKVAVPWQRISTRADAVALAQVVRALPRHGGEFTCMARMLQFVSDKIVPQLPVPATRIIVDVSGDGSDNCNPLDPIDSVRKELLAAGRVTINGLPILEGREAATLAPWYRDHVMGGPGAFILPADGFADFGRAIRQKFVVEISGAGGRAAPSSAPTVCTPCKADPDRRASVPVGASQVLSLVEPLGPVRVLER